MEDVVFVGVREGFGDGDGPVDGLVDIDGVDLGEVFVEGLSFNVVHDHVGLAIFESGIVDLNDVLVGESLRGHDFDLKAIEVAFFLSCEDLNGEGAGVVGVMSQVDDAHAAPCDFSFNLIGPKGFRWRSKRGG